MTTRPVMPKADPKTAALFRTLLPTDARITVRPMFGHTAAFVNGHMFAGTFGAHVFVRLDVPSRAALLALPGATVFAPMKNRPMKDYVQLPPAMLTDPSTATTWIARALDWTSTLPAKSTPTRRSTSARRTAARSTTRRSTRK